MRLKFFRFEESDDGDSTLRDLRKLALAASIFVPSPMSGTEARHPILNQHPCFTDRGDSITYTIYGLGTSHVIARASTPEGQMDIRTDVAVRQRGTNRPFVWYEKIFDFFSGSYEFNPSRRKWTGSDLSGGLQIAPGGIGDVNVPCIDYLDCISKKHDIEFWLAVNFKQNCLIDIVIGNATVRFETSNFYKVNTKIIGEYLGISSEPEQRLTAAMQTKF